MLDFESSPFPETCQAQKLGSEVHKGYIQKHFEFRRCIDAASRQVVKAEKTDRGHPSTYLAYQSRAPIAESLSLGVSQFPPVINSKY
jgi:hypothetical protein